MKEGGLDVRKAEVDVGLAAIMSVVVGLVVLAAVWRSALYPIAGVGCVFGWVYWYRSRHPARAMRAPDTAPVLEWIRRRRRR
jgi:hypothetical protein